VRKVLIANRGEIAVRVIRACQDAGLASVAVYADSDRDAPPARLADEAYGLSGDTAAETYLRIDKLLDVAATSGADAVHPGYGFLSENAEFAQAVLDAGLTWIGPPPAAIRDLGDKVTARHIAQRAGAPLVPGTAEPVADADEILAFAAEHGLPVAIKAAFGGGGRGLKVARTLEEIPSMFDSATREAVAAFGRGECFVERYLDRPRHVEAQVLADTHGNVIVVGTRDCSLQRRHQKLVEEAPAPFLTAEQRDKIHQSAKAICREAGYHGAGTVEYLVGQDGTISFLEVNTRLQVEHPVSEETTGIDLVREQFRIADGLPLDIPVDPAPRGHAIEFRINGEDAGRNFLPAPGAVTALTWPSGPGVRVDAGVEAGSVIGGNFDSMLAKIIVTGATRAEALERSRRVLDETVIEGIATVLPFHRLVVRDPAFTSEPFRYARSRVPAHTRQAGGIAPGRRVRWRRRDADRPDAGHDCEGRGTERRPSRGRRRDRRHRGDEDGAAVAGAPLRHGVGFRGGGRRDGDGRRGHLLDRLTAGGHLRTTFEAQLSPVRAHGGWLGRRRPGPARGRAANR
jgi:acetyl-CoA/propionyl-CoA carboxylase biotin carboxyl carrier protein